jgi:hypothetical protein
MTEASSMKTGADSSPSRIASGPILATLGFSRILGANLRCRTTCRQSQQLYLDPPSFFVLLEAAVSTLANFFRITLKPHLLN